MERPYRQRPVGRAAGICGLQYERREQLFQQGGTNTQCPRRWRVNGWVQLELHGELRRHRTGVGHRSRDLDGAGHEPCPRVRI